ncbi:MAG: hypothetical protein AAFZ65_11890 [Planctomycetota bacterium]
MPRLHARPIVLGCVLAAMVACQAPLDLAATPPAVDLRTPAGRFRAPSSAEAVQLAERTAELIGGVRAELGQPRAWPVEVWLNQLPLDEERVGIGRHVRVQRQVLGLSNVLVDHVELDVLLDGVLAHELVHALVDEDLNALPTVLEEGLAEVLAARVVDDGLSEFYGHLSLPDQRPWIQLSAQRQAEGGVTERLKTMTLAFSPDPRPLEELLVPAERGGPARVTRPEYAVGALLVERILERHGLDRLRALGRTARDSKAGPTVDEVLDAAVLDREGYAALISRGPSMAEWRAHGAFVFAPEAAALAVALDERGAFGYAAPRLDRLPARELPEWIAARATLKGREIEWDQVGGADAIERIFGDLTIGELAMRMEPGTVENYLGMQDNGGLTWREEPANRRTAGPASR